MDGTGHIRVSVSSSCVKVDYVKAYLPKDTLDGKHKNREIGFSYTIGSCIVTGINDLPSASNSEFVEVFPNPAKDVLNIKSALQSIQNIRIFDINSKLILNKIHNDKFLNLNTTEMPSGTYFIEMETADGLTETRKFIIAR